MTPLAVVTPASVYAISARSAPMSKMRAMPSNPPRRGEYRVRYRIDEAAAELSFGRGCVDGGR
jgi:hypothetical protein